MAVVTSDFLTGVLTNFRTLFDNSFEAARNISPWRDIAMEMTSTKKNETYQWLGTTPKMQKVTQDDLVLEGLFPFNYTITNDTWKAGIEVDRATFEDDSLGIVTPRLNQLGEEAARHPGELILSLVKDNGLAFDGVAFFAGTRVIGKSANIANTRAGTGTTLSALQTDLGSARADMRKFQDDQGRPMNNVPNVIMVPPELEQVMYQVLNAPQIGVTGANAPTIPGQQDVRAFSYQVIANPFLTDVNDWFVFSVQGAVKPFIYQTRVAPSLEGVTNPNTESGVIRDRFIYSARARYATGYGDPRYAVRITN